MSAITEHVIKQAEKADKKKAFVPEPMQYLKRNVKKIKQYCEQEGQDWVTMITGLEGSGKSTLGLNLALLFDEGFDVAENMIYNFKDGEFSYINFLEKYQDTPYKVPFFDEAVTALFSRSHASKDVKEAIQLFKINRDCRHYSVLISPSFWDLDLDIRERRTKSLLITFVEMNKSTNGKLNLTRKYAYYSGEKIIKLSRNPHAKIAYRDPKSLFKIVKPDFIETFPPLPRDFEANYLKFKRDFRTKLIQDIKRNSSPGKEAQEPIDDLGRLKALVT